MAHYLVRAEPKEEKLPELRAELDRDAFIGMRPFGRALSRGLNGARVDNATAVMGERTTARPRSRRSAKRCSMTTSTK